MLCFMDAPNSVIRGAFSAVDYVTVNEPSDEGARWVLTDMEAIIIMRKAAGVDRGAVDSGLSFFVLSPPFCDRRIVEERQWVGKSREVRSREAVPRRGKWKVESRRGGAESSEGGALMGGFSF